MTYTMNIRPGQRVLEVGCGAGAIAQSLQKVVPGIHYVGTDRSPTLVKKHIAILGNSVLNFSADDPVFSDDFSTSASAMAFSCTSTRWSMPERSSISSFARRVPFLSSTSPNARTPRITSYTMTWRWTSSCRTRIETFGGGISRPAFTIRIQRIASISPLSGLNELLHDHFPLNGFRWNQCYTLLPRLTISRRSTTLSLRTRYR